MMNKRASMRTGFSYTFFVSINDKEANVRRQRKHIASPLLTTTRLFSRGNCKSQISQRENGLTKIQLE